MDGTGRSRDFLPSALLTAKASIALAAVTATLTLTAALALVRLGDHPFVYYRTDPARALGGSPFVGLMTQVGVLLAWGAAAICFFAGLLVARSRGWHDALPPVALGVGVGYLALDDLLLFHEGLYPDHLGVNEDLVVSTYAVLAAAFLWHYRGFFRRHEWPPFVLAVGTLGLSLAIDAILPSFVSRNMNWLEDSVKLFGLAFLAAYLIRLSARMLVDAYPLASAEPGAVSADVTTELSRT